MLEWSVLFRPSTMFWTHTIVLLLFWNLSGTIPGWAGTRKVKPGMVKPIWIYWSKRQWVAVASASLHLIPDNHANIPPLSFLQAGCPSCRPTNSVKALFWTEMYFTLISVYCTKSPLNRGSSSSKCVLYVRHWLRCRTCQRLSRWWTTIRTCRQGSAHNPSMSSSLCTIDSRSVATSTSEAMFLSWLNAFCDVIAKENLKAGFPCLPENRRIFFWMLKDRESAGK